MLSGGGQWPSLAGFVLANHYRQFIFKPQTPQSRDEMKKLGKIVGAILVIGAFVTVLSGCDRKEGPAEKAGKAVDKTGQQIQKAGNSIHDAVKDKTQ